MILSNPFNQQEFTNFVKDFLPNFKLDVRKVEPGNSGFHEVLRLGSSAEVRTEVFVVRSSKNINSRISLTNNSFKILKTYSIYRALVVYVNDDETIWRLSLLTATPTLSPDGKTVLTLSNPRRHSYVLGTEVGVATARKYLATKGKVKDFEDLEYRFSVEAVNRDFYKEISEHFYSLVGIYGAKKEVLEKPLLKLSGKQVKVEDLQNYSVRLLGRVLFMWFLKQKTSTEGTALLPAELLVLDPQKNNKFLHNKLEPLFFEVLNKPISKRQKNYQEGVYGLVPYLNGGLFHASEGPSGDYYDPVNQKSDVEIPDFWFERMFETLDTYNFTIDENLENDVDLSIDPEMLGRVFENLLAEINPETGKIARKTSGSYYTPRSVVNYMIDESLISFFVKTTKIEKDKIKALISLDRHDDLEFPLSKKEKDLILDSFADLRVLDPACGSGAFPIGVLQKLLWIIQQIDPKGQEFLDSVELTGAENWLSGGQLDYLRKRKIIRDVIFGVDIQAIAVEIAKLRCFLSLIVDQEINDNLPNRGVVPLPNLDFKFICADSLMPLAQSDQFSLGDDPNLENKLDEVRQKYFLATDDEKKMKLRQKYEALTSPDHNLFGESLRIIQLKSFRPFATNSQALYFDSYTMFGRGNFPIIIGNPPYVSADNANKNLKTAYKNYYASAKGKYDLYFLFFESSLSMLAKDGILAFITPNKFCAADSGETLRELFFKSANIEIVSLSKIKVFESASNYPVIALIRKSENIGDLTLREIDSMENLDGQGVSSYYLTRDQYSVLPKKVIPINVSEEKLTVILKLISKFEKLGTKIDFSEGIRIDSSFEEENKNDFMIVKQYQFSRWTSVKEGSYISKKNLGKVLSNTSSRYEKSMKTKILVAEDALEISATLDENRCIPQGGLYFGVADNPKYLLGILNSRVLSSIYETLFGGMHQGGGYLRYRKNFLEVLPIPRVDSKLEKDIELVASQVLKNSQKGESVQDLENELNNLVEKAFELTSREVSILYS